jgi:hypothetical protein
MGLWNRVLKVAGVDITLQHLKGSLEVLHRDVPEIRGCDQESKGAKGLKEGKKRKVRL